MEARKDEFMESDHGRVPVSRDSLKGEETAITARASSMNAVKAPQRPPLPEGFRVRYHMSRDVLAWIWWKRSMLSPRKLIGNVLTLCILAYFALGFLPFVLSDPLYIGLYTLLLAIALISPVKAYWDLAKAVDGNPQLIDPKTVEFSPFGFVAEGPDWKTENAWGRVRRFFEDDRYSYLCLTNIDWLVSPIPKTAFTPEQKQMLREYVRNGMA